MFNYLFHPYLRWFRDRSESDRPDLNIDRDGSPPQNLIQPPVNFSIPESDMLLQSAPPTGLVNFVAEQPNEVPGFRVGLRDEVPGFNLNENDLPHPETTWPDWVETSPPESSDTAQTLPVPPGVEEPDPPIPQPPEWLRNVLAMPVPQLSTAFDPQTGRRIVPYEPLINWTRPYPSVDQNVREPDAAGAYGPEIGAMPGPSSLEAPAIKQSAPLARLERRADIDAPSNLAHQTAQEASSWSQLLNDGQPDAHLSGVNAEAPWRDAVLTQQQTPFPQEQRTRLDNVPKTTFIKNPVGFQPTPLSGASSIEFSVYNPDVDPGYDDLFDLVEGVQDNKIQGDAAEDAELKRIKKENGLAAFAPKTRIYAAGASDYYTVSDIMFRRNGTSLIVITEVKSGDGKLTPNQAATLGEAMRTGNIYIISEKAAKELKIDTHKTFAAQHIIPQVYVTGGNQKEIARQLRNQGLEVIPEKVRRGQPPRLRVVRPI